MKNNALLEEKYLVDSFLMLGPRPLSSYSFVSIFAWCDFFDIEFKMINSSLCIFAHGETGSFLYLPPLGSGFDSSTIQSVFEHMSKGGKLKPVNRIENIPGNLLSAFPEGSYNHYLKPAEYVYAKEDLVALKGNAYKSQRHDCNSFRAHHPEHSFEPYTDADFESCMAVFDAWASNRASTNSDEVYRSMLQENRLVHARLLKFWERLGLIARVLKVDGRIIGYTLGFAVDEHTFCVYAEIADFKVTGSAAFLFKSFCEDEQLKYFSRINAMDDFAMPNVTRAKLAYHPSELIGSYTVSLKTPAIVGGV